MEYGWNMAISATHALSRPKGGDTEKITINLSPIDLGNIDLLVQEGFYSNRADLIRMAIRNQIAGHATVVAQTVVRRSLVLGLQHFSRADLEAAQAANERLDIHALGLVSIAPDVPAELALATIASVVVLGAFHASPAVKAALADRIY
jgi:Arc/MetJ-type ribon-helix-helix transcriptional regulator